MNGSECRDYSRGFADLGAEHRILQHDRTVSESRYEAVLALNGFLRLSVQSTAIGGSNLLAYEISATLSLLKQFLCRTVRIYDPSPCQTSLVSYQVFPALASANYDLVSRRWHHLYESSLRQ